MMAWDQAERQALLSHDERRALPTPYRSIDNGTFDDSDQPLVTRRGHPAALPSHTSTRSSRNASALTVRVYAVCPDIHCPSCISHLSSLVASLDIHPICRIAISSADTSLIHRTVTVDLEVAPSDSDNGAHAPQGSHGPARAAAKRLRRILEELARILAQDGFSVDHMRSKVVAGPEADYAYKQGLNQMLDASDLYRRSETTAAASSLPDFANTKKQGSSMLGALPASLGNTLRSAWSRTATGDTESARIHHERWRRHVQVCRACRDGDADHVSLLEDAASLPQQQNDDELKDAGESHRRVVAVLSIAGMTCSSCAQSITTAVQSEASHQVDTIKVDVLSASATVTAHPAALPSIIEAIDDAGFEAHLVKSEPVRSSSPGRQRDEPDEHTWKAKLSIHGMTCASCVQSVGSALQSYADQTNAAHAVQIVTTSVDLMSKSADIVLSAPDKTQAEARLGELVEQVQDVGFDAELLTLQPESGKARAASDGAVFRHVRIEVQGMFCQSCVAKVRSYFSRLRAAHASDIDVADDDLDGFTLAQPLLSFSYRSGNPSRLRLRCILDEINRLDSTFSARYAPPPSLASRSAVLARAELRDLVIRLAITAVFALPALAISMIAPLLSPHSALRRWTAAYVVGRATRGEVAMWLIATPVQFGVGALFLGKAWRSVSAMWKRRRSWTDRFLRFGNMDVLVALGTLVAYTSSLVLLGLDALRTPPPAQEAQMDMTYFEVSVFLVLFILLGRVLEAVTKRKTGDAVAELGRMKPRTAQLLLDPSEPARSRTEQVDVDLLDVSDLVLVPHGASPPLDGVVLGTAATALFDESSLSGEARPVAKQVGEQVYAGTLNVSHTAVAVQVRVVPGACVIDDILDVVHEAAGKKARIAQLADAITGVFVPAIVYVSLAVLTVWFILLYSGMLGEDWQRRHVEHYGEPGARFVYALQFAIACLLVACPCGIGLAAPTSQLAGIGLASQHGVLVNGGGEAFRAASTASDRAGQLVVVFDKTGTITKGDAVAVADYRFAAAQYEALQEAQLLHCIELVEQASTHPYARAVRVWIAERPSATPAQPSQYNLEDVVEVPGKGVRATFRRASQVDGAAKSFVLLVGNRALMRELGAETPDAHIADAEREWSAASHSVVYVGVRWDSSAPGAVALALAMSDEIRHEAAWVIAHLSSRYAAEVWMVTGDNEGTARSVAAQVGIPASRVVAGVLPIDKKAWVERLSSADPESSFPARQRRWFGSARGRTVLFVGDGINDSPALSAASVGVALGSGSSIAHSSADFILLARTAPLLSIPVLLQLSRATHGKVTSNFAWAFVFNLVLIPVAAGALVGLGVTMGPELSGLAMAFSSTSVVLNSLSLRLWRPSRQLAKQLEHK